MEKIRNILPIVLLVLVLWLFIDRYGLQEKKDTLTKKAALTDSTGQIPRIAYVNIDSVLLQYEQAIEFNSSFGEKRQKSEAEYAQKAKALEKEYMEFQDKVQRGGFLSQTSMKAQQESLLRKKEDLDKLESKLTNDLLAEQQKLNEQLYNTILNYIQTYNRTAGYDLILTNTGNGTILYGNPAYNITSEIVEGLNLQYKEQKK
ncbi:MAG TPA: OmpH family outer membrane protein [Salinivirgaceae bacterium]|nr:OmpH family outer membrane protein [Salinivirgaceae bacterium]